MALAITIPAGVASSDPVIWGPDWVRATLADAGMPGAPFMGFPFQEWVCAEIVDDGTGAFPLVVVPDSECPQPNPNDAQQGKEKARKRNK